ncbi:hypothetical protein SAMD00019534_123030, partial [Acytostelium subglobosum LB1]|uniref:hypothetical protein n=1 Tax=Acytostelium subglobosum LB1 TaxID=1410327 RepID=UPI00064512E5
MTNKSHSDRERSSSTTTAPSSSSSTDPNNNNNNITNNNGNMGGSNGNILFDDDSDVETYGSNDANKTSRKPFQRFGIIFLAVAILMGLVLVTVPAALLPHMDTFNDGILFRVLFGAFVFSLLACLWSVYYLGGETHAWEDPTGNDLTFNFSNVIAFIGILIEFIQVFSFSFNQRSQFLGSEPLQRLNYLAIPWNPGSVFRVMYWVMFVTAFTPYIFIISIRLFLRYYTIKYGENDTSDWMSKYQQKIYSVLWFLVNTLYIPVISTMFGGVDCTFKDGSVKWDSDPSIESCLKGVHIVFIVCSMVALIVYYPAASFAQAQTQNISDIKFKPKIVFIFIQGKIILAAMAIFATQYETAYLLVVLAVDIIFLFINIYFWPCTVSWINRMRTVFFSFCCISTISSLVALSHNVARFVPLIIMLTGWFIFSVLYAISYKYNVTPPFMSKIQSLQANSNAGTKSTTASALPMDRRQ